MRTITLTEAQARALEDLLLQVGQSWMVSRGKGRLGQWAAILAKLQREEEETTQ